ncbi:MAG: biotin/lipoyl-containing protein [Bryobacteraceae bacterium]
MKRRVVVHGETREIELSPNGSSVAFTTGDDNGSFAIVETEPGVWSVLLGGRSYVARVHVGRQGTVVEVDGHAFPVKVADPREWQEGSDAGGAGGKQKIEAPMPGRVIRLLVEAGQQVEAGQGVIVVEGDEDAKRDASHPRQGDAIRVEAASVSAATTCWW